MTPTYSIVSTFERPELAAVSARWRWEAFFRDSGRLLEEVLTSAAQTASEGRVMPQTLVLLEDDVPIGTASLVAHDLDERPELCRGWPGCSWCRRRGGGGMWLS